MDQKVKETLEAVYKLPAKGKQLVDQFLGSSPEFQAAIIQGLSNGEAPKRRGRPPGKKNSTEKITTKKANGKEVLPEEVLKHTGASLVREAAKFKADGDGKVTRQAVQFGLRKAKKDEHKQPLFGEIMAELQEEGVLVVNGNGWVIK